MSDSRRRRWSSCGRVGWFYQPRSGCRTSPRTWIMGAIKFDRAISTVSSTRHRACTPSLSTWSSSTALKGVLVSRWVSRLDAFSGLSRPYVLRCTAAGATTAPPEVRSSGPLVLGTNPLNTPTPTADRDRTVSRRSEPQLTYHFNRRTAEPLGPSPAQDVIADIEVPNDPVDMDSWGSSACYPRRTFYPLSDGPPTRDHRNHYDRLSSLLDMSVSQSGRLMPLHSTTDFRPV